MKRIAIVLSTAAVAFGGLAVTAASAGADVLGQLGQLAGLGGCYSLTGGSEEGAGTCTDLHGGNGPSEVAISPDGRFAYVSEYEGTTGLLAFSRDTATGRLTQLAGADGCYTATGAGESGAGTCTDVRAVNDGGDGRGMAISADGRFLYLASQSADAVVVFARNPDTGVLTQLAGTDGCVSRTGAGEAGAPGEGAGTCADGLGLDGPSGAVLTPDGRHLIVQAYAGVDPTVAVFARDEASGRIAQLPGTAGCLAGDGETEGVAGACTDIHTGGNGPGIAVSPDGRHVYLTAYNEALLSFSRNAETGALAQLPGTQGCMTDDGAGESGAGTCADGRGVDGPYHVVASREGTHVYVSAVDGDFVLAFRRDADSGVLTQLPGTDGCTSKDGASEDGAGTCADARALEGPYALTMSPDDRNVYVPDVNSDAVLSFARDPATGALTQLAGTLGCTSTTGAGGPGEGVGTCTDGRGLKNAYSVTVSPDNGFVYVPSYADDRIAAFSRQASPTCSAATATAPHGGSVTVELPCGDVNGDAITRSIVDGPVHGTLGDVDQASGRVTYTAARGFAGRDTFTFRAVDATSAGPPATATVEVAAPPPGQPPLVAPPLLLPPRDTTDPRCRGLRGTARARDLRRGRLRLRLRCSEAARLAARLTMSRADARRIRLLQRRRPRRITLGRGTAAAPSGGRAVTLTVRLSKRTRARLRRTGTRRLRRARLRLTLVATDAAGNRSTVSRRVRLRR